MPLFKYKLLWLLFGQFFIPSSDLNVFLPKWPNYYQKKNMSLKAICSENCTLHRDSKLVYGKDCKQAWPVDPYIRFILYLPFRWSTRDGRFSISRIFMKKKFEIFFTFCRIFYTGCLVKQMQIRNKSGWLRRGSCCRTWSYHWNWFQDSTTYRGGQKV